MSTPASRGNPYLYIAGFMLALVTVVMLWPSAHTAAPRTPHTPAPPERLVSPPPYTAPPQQPGRTPQADATPAPLTTQPQPPRGVDPDLDGDLEREDDHHPPRTTEEPDTERADKDRDRGRIGDGEIEIWRWLF